MLPHFLHHLSKMIIQAEQLYQTMMADIVYCRQKNLGEEQEIECCFQIVNNYWRLLKNDIAKYEFVDTSEEVFFFKKIKPLFIAEIEYYGFVHHAQLFKKNTNEPGELNDFWKREANRLQKFKEENIDFYQYHKSGDDENDQLWFIRESNDSDATSHDWMVARVLALEKYEVYVLREMASADPSLLRSSG